MHQSAQMIDVVVVVEYNKIVVQVFVEPVVVVAVNEICVPEVVADVLLPLIDLVVIVVFVILVVEQKVAVNLILEHFLVVLDKFVDCIDVEFVVAAPVVFVDAVVDDTMDFDGRAVPN